MTKTDYAKCKQRFLNSTRRKHYPFKLHKDLSRTVKKSNLGVANGTQYAPPIGGATHLFVCRRAAKA
ncbi:hypothetical protein ABID59_004358 [Bradyrhizobium sp. S3.3.6]|uniref:hypothetical protein n=1 Tax=Bradyrhizobium sp. S3.3.6 TaxID=3156429 RepID=UPI00339340EC